MLLYYLATRRNHVQKESGVEKKMGHQDGNFFLSHYPRSRMASKAQGEKKVHKRMKKKKIYKNGFAFTQREIIVNVFFLVSLWKHMLLD